MSRCAVVIPAYNGAATLRRVIDGVRQAGGRHLIVVDDGSRDDSCRIARDAGVEPIVHPSNRGYGAAQKSGFRAALDTGLPFVALMHDDLQYGPARLPTLVAPLADDGADAVLGSRMLRPGALRGGMPLPRWIANRLLTTIQNWGYGVRLTDFHTGLRAYAAAALRSIPFDTFADDFRFDLQMLDALLATGARVIEVPIPTRYDAHSGSMGYRHAPRYIGAVVRAAIDARLHAQSLRNDWNG